MLEIWNAYSGYIISAGVILITLLVFMLVYRALGGAVKGRRGQRLGVSEYHEIDKTRRLVLVRRDNVEHLLMIGGGGDDVVIETEITGGVEAAEASQSSLLRRSLRNKRTSAQAAADQSDEAEEDVGPPRTAPRPAVFGDRVPLRAVKRDDPRMGGTRPYSDGSET